jgi:hypothetical protein
MFSAALRTSFQEMSKPLAESSLRVISEKALVDEINFVTITRSNSYRHNVSSGLLVLILPWNSRR